MTKRALGGLGALLLPAALAAAQPPEQTVTWYQMDLPPAYLTPTAPTPRDLQTVVDLAAKRALEERGYTVVFRRIHTEQLAQERRSSALACTGAQLQLQEMEEYLEYSIPHSTSLPPLVVIKRDRYEEFRPLLDAEGRISLEAALARPELLLGVAAGRPYGGNIDGLLASHAQSEHVLRRSAMRNSQALLEMLLSERIGYTLLYPWEANYLADGIGRRDEIRKIPVQGMPPYVTVVVSCTKGPWGHEVIRVVNCAIESLRATAAYQQLKESWLDDDERRLHRQYRAEVFGATAPRKP